MKIAFVNDTFIEGRGADTVVYELAREIGKRQEVYVIASEVGGFKENNFKIIKINSEKLYTGKIKDLLFFNKIKKYREEILKLQKRHHFDLFNVHHSSLNPAFENLPTVITWHGSPLTKNPARKMLNKFVLPTLNKNKKTIVISNYLRKVLLKYVEPKKLVVIHDGVSGEFTPGKKDLGYMFYVGRHEQHKRVDELIRISKELNFPLKIAGNGPLTENLKKYCKKINASKVEFLGRISRKELIKCYQDCSFFISASRWEGFGLIFIEAGACEKPSIAYNCCSMPEVVLNKKTGLLANNYGEFKKFAWRLIEDKKIRETMGKNAFVFSQKFHWNEVAKKYEELFNNIK